MRVCVGVGVTVAVIQICHTGFETYMATISYQEHNLLFLKETRAVFNFTALSAFKFYIALYAQ